MEGGKPTLQRDMWRPSPVDETNRAGASTVVNRRSFFRFNNL
jgi:hypothetical protein